MLRLLGDRHRYGNNDMIPIAHLVNQRRFLAYETDLVRTVVPMVHPHPYGGS